ncbi:OLC1v1007820C1 [Oldenlandia corymbosa var. corymbosa]|uniref:OLC1v1007820C1 n=1 Tax=Oldenlandia corymbosa var. corymbosa TaxID=529605 RepID=A0AAV1DNB7_OLDCO|nr:OLC1v1007820C1 [Oldenlandia corymbosa var. corymbosa]
MSPKMLSCSERIDKLMHDIEKKNASYFSQEDYYHSNTSVYQLPPPQPTLRKLAARQPTLRELAARQPTLRELAALQSSPCQPSLRQLGSSYQQPPTQLQLSVREAALRDFQSEKGQQLIEEVNQYKMSVGLPEYDPIGNLLKLNKNEKISEDDSLVQSPHPPSQTELECEELEENEMITSLDITTFPDSSVSKEGFEVDTYGEVVHSIRDSVDDVKVDSMKDQGEDQWYKIEFEKEDVVVLEYKFIFSHGKENHYKRFIVAAEHGFFWYRDGTSNKRADTLSKLASSNFANLSHKVLVEMLPEPSIHPKVSLAITEDKDTWMTSFIRFLKNGMLPDSKQEAQALKLKAVKYTLKDGKAEFYHCEKGDLSMSAFLDRLKELYACLVSIGDSITYRDVVMQVVMGLGPEYNAATSQISAQKPLSTFDECLSRLLLEEAKLAKQH